jgi:hypothetical protein
MAVSVSQLQQTLGIAQCELMLVCGCLAMKTHVMKFITNSTCADVAFIGSLELDTPSGLCLMRL